MSQADRSESARVFVFQSIWQEVDRNRCLQNTLGVMATEFSQRLTISHVQGKLAPVMCNAPRINQVFRNLLLNAVQGIAGKGEIRIEAVWVEVEIADTGQGIAPENFERIFEPFFTTRPVGQGVRFGLSVGNGTSFIVRLPKRLEPVAGEWRES